MNPKTVMNEDCCPSATPLALDEAMATLATTKRILNDAEEELEACAYRFSQAYARRDSAKLLWDEARLALLTITKGY